MLLTVTSEITHPTPQALLECKIYFFLLESVLIFLSQLIMSIVNYAVFRSWGNNSLSNDWDAVIEHKFHFGFMLYIQMLLGVTNRHHQKVVTIFWLLIEINSLWSFKYVSFIFIARQDLPIFMMITDFQFSSKRQWCNDWGVYNCHTLQYNICKVIFKMIFLKEIRAQFFWLSFTNLKNWLGCFMLTEKKEDDQKPIMDLCYFSYWKDINMVFIVGAYLYIFTLCWCWESSKFHCKQTQLTLDNRVYDQSVEEGCLLDDHRATLRSIKTWLTSSIFNNDFATGWSFWLWHFSGVISPFL